MRLSGLTVQNSEKWCFDIGQINCFFFRFFGGGFDEELPFQVDSASHAVFSFNVKDVQVYAIPIRCSYTYLLFWHQYPHI